MKWFLAILLIQASFVFSMDRESNNQNISDKKDLSDKSRVGRKKLFTFLWSLEKLREENSCYQLPRELKVKIISYVPELFYYPGIITIALPHMEKHELPKFIEELSHDSLIHISAKGYTGSNANIIIDLMKNKIKRKKSAFFVKNVAWREKP